MEDKYYKTLREFAYYIDNMQKGNDKGFLSHIFTMFINCDNERLRLERLKKIIDETETKI